MSDPSSSPGRSRTWVRNNIVGLVALFVALSGTTYAAQNTNGSDSKAQKSAKKKAKRGPAGPAGANGAAGAAGPAGSPATNALTLGGQPASSYQRRCDAGAVWGVAFVDTTAMGGTYTTTGVGGFNCSGGAPEARRNWPGDYSIRFPGSPAGFASVTCGLGVCDTNSIGFIAGGEFNVLIGDSGGNLVDGGKFYFTLF